MIYERPQRSKLADMTDSDIAKDVENTVKSIQNPDFVSKIMDTWNDNQTTLSAQFYGADFQYLHDDHGTSHVCILAPNGDAVSATSTINTYFGSGIMSNSTRIVFNNEMDDFSTPNTTNYFGIPASEQNFIKPGKRPTSSMSPSIFVDDQNRVKFVIGASGGPRIISSIAYVSKKFLWEIL